MRDLIQIGNSPFYRTPSEPADPRDCDRWPDSPWCGGNPLERDTGIGFKPDIDYDGCNISFGITPILGHVTLPKYEIAYRREWCRNPPPPPLEPPDVDVEEEEYFNPNSPEFDNIPPGSMCLFYYGFSSMSENVRAPDYGGHTYRVETKEISLIEIPDEDSTPLEESLGTIYLKGKFIERCSTATFTNKEEYESEIDSLSLPYEDWREQTQPWTGSLVNRGDLYSKYIGSTNPRLQIRNVTTTGNAISAFGDPDNAGFYLKTIEWIKEQNWIKSRSVITGGSDQRYVITGNEKYKFWICKINSDDIYTRIPPPPPPPEHCKCMGCCPTNNNNNGYSDDLIRLLLVRVGTPTAATIFDADENKTEAQASSVKLLTLFQSHQATINRVEKISKIIGIDSFPLEVPETVLEPEKTGIWGKIFAYIKGDDKRKINSLMELLIWQQEQDSATMGQWHQVIEIEDADSTKAGKQRERIVLPNVAETMKEAIILLTELVKTQELMLDIALKTITETSSTKVEVAKTQVLARDIQEYLDYPTKMVKHKVPVQIQIPGRDSSNDDLENLIKFLQQSETPFSIDEWTGEGSWHDQLLDIQQVMAMLRASLFTQVPRE